jgi:hypothetical protein
MVPDDASGRRADDGMMASDMPGDAANHCPLDAALGRCDTRSSDHTDNRQQKTDNDFVLHGLEHTCFK